MPRPSKPPRLWERYDTAADRKERTQNFQWVILDRGKQHGTGCRGTGSRQAAEQAFARYLSSKYELPRSAQAPEDVAVSLVLAHYLENLRADIAAPERQAYAVMALSAFWRSKTCGEINRKSCEAYADQRKSLSTARRELGVLTAALNLAHREGILKSKPVVTKPKESNARVVWLNRSELAALLWELRRNRKTRHAARRVICQYYGGSRPGTVANTTWEERPDGPWVDLENGMWWRAGDEEEATNKVRKPHVIPRSLLSFLRMWKRRYGGTYVIEHPRYPGQPVRDIGNALETAARKAKIGKRVTPHTLKHTAITLAIGAGMTIEDAVVYFSTSAETIQKNYWHHSPFYQQHAVAAMAAPGKRKALQ